MWMETLERSVGLMTGLLALATFALAYYTWRMAAVTRQAFEVDSRPYLAFSELMCLIGTPTTGPQMQVGVRLQNTGRVLVYFQVKQFDVRANGLVPSNPTINSIPGVVFPGMPAEWIAPTISGVDAIKDFTGHVHFKIEYWLAPEGKQHYEIEEDLDFNGNASVPWSRWTRTAPAYYT